LKIKPESLEAQLRERLLPAYLISGDEALLTGEAADAVRRAARAQGFTEREVHFMDRGGDWDAVRESVASMSLFAERKIVEVRLPNGRPGVTGAKVLKAIVESGSADNVIIILTGRLEREVANSEWVRTVEAQGGVVTVWPLPPAQLIPWLEQRCRKLGLQPAREALELLAERTEGNLLAAQQELEKLKLLAPDGRIDAQSVLVSSSDSARFDVGELDRALSQGDCPRALRVLAGLRSEGVELPLVLWAVNKALHAVAAANGGGGASRGGYGPSAKPRRLRVSLAAVVARAARADGMAKGRLRGDAWDELALLAADLCGLPGLPPAAALN